MPLLFEFKGQRNSTHPKKVPVAVVKEPIVDHHVPGAVIVSEGCGVPPVLDNQA